MSCSCGSSSDKDLYLPQPATVLKSESMTELEQFLEFKLDSGAELGHMPGQFVELSLPAYGEAPFSISSSPTRNGSFEMVVRRVGNVTSGIHGLEAGDKVGIRGPYGTHFPVDDGLKGKDIMFVCGGIGLVPVRSAIHYVLHNRDDYGDVKILFGCKSPAERLFTDELARWDEQDDVDFLETVDKGDENWTGNVGVITTLLPKVEIDPDNTVAIICGPPVMYKFVIWDLYEMGMTADDIYVSLERRMKCGLGKCGHCQVNGIYVCQDGPVFNLGEIEEVREAIQ
ncbi:MAG: FAD/NAD(P)-binding protein [Candidatus Brocadiia bacterium]